MMLVVISDEAESNVTMLNPGFENFLIPLDHLVVAMSLVHDVTESAGRGHCDFLRQFSSQNTRGGGQVEGRNGSRARPRSGERLRLYRGLLLTQIRPSGG